MEWKEPLLKEITNDDRINFVTDEKGQKIAAHSKIDLKISDKGE